MLRSPACPLCTSVSVYRLDTSSVLLVLIDKLCHCRLASATDISQMVYVVPGGGGCAIATKDEFMYLNAFQNTVAIITMVIIIIIMDLL